MFTEWAEAVLLAILIPSFGNCQFHPLYRAHLGDPLVRIKLLKTRAPDNENLILKGILAFPNFPGPFPAVIIVHDRFGRNSWADSRALYFARQGMVGYAVDYLGMNYSPADHAAAAEETARQLLDRGILQARLQGAIMKLRGMPFVDTKRIIMIGYDTGGLGCLGMGHRSPVSGIAAINPDLSLPTVIDLPNTTHLLITSIRNDRKTQILTDKLTEYRMKWELHVFGAGKSDMIGANHLESWTLSLLFIADVMRDTTNPSYLPSKPIVASEPSKPPLASSILSAFFP